MINTLALTDCHENNQGKAYFAFFQKKTGLVAEMTHQSLSETAAINLNQHIFGIKVAENQYWQTMITLKSKYLLPESIRSDMLFAFKQFENEFNPKYSQLSCRDKILISWMRVMAYWDKDTSGLIIGNVYPFLEPGLGSLLQRCLQALSAHVCIILQRAASLLPLNSVIPTSIMYQ